MTAPLMDKSKTIVNGQYMLMHPQGNMAQISAEFDGAAVKIDTNVIVPPAPTPPEEPKLTILCPFCNAPYTARMEMEFNYSMGSEWTGIYGEEKKLDIYCDNCKKLVYTKSED
jgi:hypothetical protein